MRVRDGMSTRVVSVREDEMVEEIARRFLAYDVSGAPVLDAEGRLIGVVTEADLLGREAYADRPRRRLLGLVVDLLSGGRDPWILKAAGTVARDVMSAPVETCAPDEQLTAVAHRMLLRGFERLP